MRKQLIALAAIAATLAPQFASAQDSGEWIVRARALHLMSDNGDETDLGLKLEANDKTFPEFDITYFFSPNLAAELILTYPQKHSIHATAGGTDTIIGNFKHLPPTLTAQYHFTGMAGFRPYVGGGVNYTLITDQDVVGGAAKLKKNSFGLALQAGVDVPVGGGWLVNFDVKKVQIKTDVTIAGTNHGDFKVDPLLVSLGVGKRF